MFFEITSQIGQYRNNKQVIQQIPKAKREFSSSHDVLVLLKVRTVTYFTSLRISSFTRRDSIYFDSLYRFNRSPLIVGISIIKLIFSCILLITDRIINLTLFSQLIIYSGCRKRGKKHVRTVSLVKLN